MILILTIVLGIVLGYLAYKISLRNQLLGYLVAITPYSILFFLSLENRDMWGHYRVIALFTTIIASIFCLIKRLIDKKREAYHS